MSEFMEKPKNDIAEDALERMSELTLFPGTLQEIVALSRAHFGWYTKHALRCIEYPWIIERCRALGQNVLDVGAGVSPIPIFLAERCGKEVVTVDYSTAKVKLDRIGVRNEWGFLDYAQISDKIRSYNCDIAEFDAPARFDVVYSVSVIEHMPAEIRRKMIEVFGTVCAPNADILFTVDLYGASTDLWNHDRGKPVESREAHGKLQDLIGELENQGFKLEYLETLRRARANAPGDLAMLHAARRA
ncbi:MAG: class I SAM-dependent methyltransferase [Pseudomonadota bacterium]